MTKFGLISGKSFSSGRRNAEEPLAIKASVREDDWGHVLERDPCGLESHREAIRGACGGEHAEWAFAVAAVEGLHEVGLLGFCRQARRRAAALHVDDHERELGHDGQSDALSL